MHSKSLFFFVNQTFASCVFDKTQTLTRSQTYSKCSGVGNNSERKEKIRKEKKRERKMEGKVSIQLKSQILYITCIIFLNNFNFHAVFFFNVLIKLKKNHTFKSYISSVKGPISGTTCLSLNKANNPELALGRSSQNLPYTDKVWLKVNGV